MKACGDYSGCVFERGPHEVKVNRDPPPMRPRTSHGFVGLKPAALSPRCTSGAFMNVFQTFPVR